MYSTTKIICTCFFLIWLNSTFAQTLKKDSILNEIKKASQDSSKIKLLLNLSFDLRAVESQKALEYATTALKLSKKIFDKKREAKSHNNIGLAYFYQSMFDSAIAHYENSLKIGNTISDSTSISTAYSQLGNVYKALSNFPLSIEYHKKALKIRLNKKDTLNIVQSYNNIGNAYVKNGQYELAMESYFKSLGMLKGRKGTNEYPSALGGLGNIYSFQKNSKKANEYYKMTYDFYKGGKDIRGLSIALLNLGDSYRVLGQYDSSLFYLKQCIKLNERTKNKQRMAEVYVCMADLYAQTEQLYDATKYLLKVADIYSELKLTEESARTGIQLSELFLQSGDKVNGKYYLNESLKNIDSIKNKETVIASYQKIANCFHILGDDFSAYKFLNKSVLLNDSLQSSRGVQTILQMQSAFDFKTKENEIELLNSEKKASNYKIDRQQSVIISLSIGGILFIVLVFFIFRGYKKAKEANMALSLANKQINEKNKNISDSINYAQNIQNAILTIPKSFREQFKENYFILYKPKDVVSGDFFWIEYHDRHLLIAAADCTGHGVPGSLMSMLGFEKLKQAVHEKMLIRPNKILSFTNKSFVETFSLNESASILRDGMDTALCTYNLATNELLFSGANRPLWIATTNDAGEKEIKILKATKAAIGGFTEKEQQFDLVTYNPKKGDTIYLFTDGYADQFGGERNKKFTVKRFRQLILSLSHLPMAQQKEQLDTEFNSWKSTHDQVDDLLVIGFRIS